jgi:hypothetical protein
LQIIGILVFLFLKNVLFKLEDGASIYVCPSHIHTHTFQTISITIVVPPTRLHCSSPALRFLLLQHSQFTEESGKLCNDVVEVSVMDDCYCFSMLVASCHFGAVCCTVLFLLLCGFFTVWFLVHRGILYSTGSRTPRDLVQRADS